MKDQDRVRESLCDALLPMPFAPHTPHSATRRFFSLFTILLFLFSVLWTGVRAATRHPQIEALDLVGEQVTLGVNSHPVVQPDFAKYVNLTTLHDDELRARGGRVIFVGDIHGMHKSFSKLLKKLKFDNEHDVLVHTGDIILKGPQSRKVIQEMMQIKSFGVRGNQDQKVIEWRGWIEWVLSQDGGKKWLRKMEKRIEDKDLSKSDFKHFRKAAAARGWDIPDGWDFGDDIYRLARKLRADEYQYLLDLPIALHIPSLHTITVHAGILPMDPRHKMLSHHQPLSHAPKAPKRNKTEPVLRNLQELSLFRDIPQNTDPWVKLNMRSILDNGKVSRDNSGTPWSKLWHKVIDLCDGFDVKPAQASVNATAEFNSDHGWEQWMEEEFKGAHSLPCRDVTVVYGHTASRGLDLKKWSKGLDTGCVYNLRLTGLVLGKKWKPSVGNSTLVDSEIDLYTVDEDVEGDVVSFGKKGRGKVVQVQCAGGKSRLH